MKESIHLEGQTNLTCMYLIRVLRITKQKLAETESRDRQIQQL